MTDRELMLMQEIARLRRKERDAITPGAMLTTILVIGGYFLLIWIGGPGTGRF